MAILSWGKPKIEYCACSNNGELPSSPTWTEITLPVKQGTAQLETEQGDRSEALDEGGDVVDVRVGKSKYTFSFSLYMKKNASKPISDSDGVVAMNYGFRITAEDSAAMGFLLPKCSVSVQETWTSEEGGLWVYTCSALKPSSGNALQRYSVTPTPPDED